MKKIKNPLIRRIPKELIGDWKKYLVVFLFLVLTIGFVSGMYVANESMITSANEGVTKYKQEDGHFELKKQADATLLSAIETGEKADVKQYYLDEAKKKLDKKLPKKFKEKFDEKFPDKFKKEFDKKFPEQFKKSFDKEFKKQFEQSFPAKFASSFKKEFDPKFKQSFDATFVKQFDAQFAAQVKQSLLAQGMDAQTAGQMLDTAVAQAKKDGSYKKAYDSAYSKAYAPAYKKAYDSAYSSAYNEAHDKAYSEAYDKAYDEAYDKAYKKAYDKAYKKAYKKAYDKAYKKAYDKAWKKAQDKIEDKYADAEEKYKLNDPDFKATKTTLYENFFRNEEEDYNNDGKKDGTIRVFAKTKDINLACMLQGSFPQKADEIAIDRMHADNVGIKVGDTVTVSGETYKVVGLLAYANYSTLHEKTTDLMFDALKFDVAMVTQNIAAGTHHHIRCKIPQNSFGAAAGRYQQTYAFGVIFDVIPAKTALDAHGAIGGKAKARPRHQGRLHAVGVAHKQNITVRHPAAQLGGHRQCRIDMTGGTAAGKQNFHTDVTPFLLSFGGRPKAQCPFLPAGWPAPCRRRKRTAG